LRAQSQLTQAQRDEIIETALKQETAEKFWRFFLGKHYGKGPMGYLEAKFPSFVPGDYFESIEVPGDKFSEIMSWPESEPYKNIIKEIIPSCNTLGIKKSNHFPVLSENG
jgi:hypothetical protein